MKIIDLKKMKSNRKGFTLLFSILVSIMVLAVGASIINISLKQVILSSSGRESQYAFYAANTGIECALFWDLNGVVLENNSTLKYVFPPPGEQNLRITNTDGIQCAGRSITESWDISNPNRTVFKITISSDIIGAGKVEYCAEVIVEKESSQNVSTGSNENSNQGSVTTTITSKGYNTCDIKNDKRAVERGLVLQYRS